MLYLLQEQIQISASKAAGHPVYIGQPTWVTPISSRLCKLSTEDLLAATMKFGQSPYSTYSPSRFELDGVLLWGASVSVKRSWLLQDEFWQTNLSSLASTKHNLQRFFIDRRPFFKIWVRRVLLFLCKGWIMARTQWCKMQMERFHCIKLWYRYRPLAIEYLLLPASKREPDNVKPYYPVQPDVQLLKLPMRKIETNLTLCRDLEVTEIWPEAIWKSIEAWSNHHDSSPRNLPAWRVSEILDHTIDNICKDYY